MIWLVPNECMGCQTFKQKKERETVGWWSEKIVKNVEYFQVDQDSRALKYLQLPRDAS